LTTVANAAACKSFARLGEFLADGRLTVIVASVEQALSGTRAREVAEVARSAGFEPALLESGVTWQAQ